MSATYHAPVRRPLLRRAFLLALVPGVILAGRLAKSEEVRFPTDDGGEWTITIIPAERFVAALEEPTAPLPAGENLVPAFPDTVAPVGEIADEPVEEFVPVPQVESAPPAQETQSPMPPAPAPLVMPSTVGTPPAVTDEYYGSFEEGITIVPNVRHQSQAGEYRRIYDSIPYSRTEYLANPSYRHDTAMEILTGIPRQSAGQGNYVPRLNEPAPRSPMFLYNRYGGIGPYYGSGGVSSYHGGFGLGYQYVPQYAPAFRYFLPLEDLY